jgi:membrane associated rhomboid family serine protease
MRPQLAPITQKLILANVLLFLATMLLEYNGLSLMSLLSCYFPFSPNFKYYQIISHMFMHSGFSHLLFNMLALWSFGSTVEFTVGSKRFLWLYFAAGLAGLGLFEFWHYLQIQPVFERLVAANFDFPEFYQYLKLNSDGRPAMNIQQFKLQADAQALFNLYSSPMLGASSATSALLTVFAVFYPEAKIMMLFPPIPIKAKYMMPALLILYAYLGLSHSNDNIAHFAHLGGALLGLILALVWKKQALKGGW